MSSGENVTAGQKRSKDSLDMDDECNSNNSSLNGSEPSTKKHRVSCFENLHQSIVNSKSTMEQSNKDKNGIFLLVITSSAGGWTCDQVMDHVREEIGESALLVNDFTDTEAGFKIKLKFGKQEQRNYVLEELKTKQAQGKLCVDTEDVESDEEVSLEGNMSITNRDVKAEDGQSNISVDVWDVDPNTLYGLKEEFLESLNIVPPLSNCVLVTNFRCDKSELKEVMELAGHVVMCSVVTVGKRYANVMYSHPLEAVQAISMLNGQSLYGQNLIIKMDTSSEYWKVLPKGLAHLGPGLGKYGKPVRDIAKQYERFLSGKSTLIETKIFLSDKSSDLLKEIIQPSLSRPDSRTFHTPDPVSDTPDKLTDNDHSKIKDISTQEATESDNPTKPEYSDLETSTPQFHNKAITNDSPQTSKYSSNDSLADTGSDKNIKESKSRDPRVNSGEKIQVSGETGKDPSVKPNTTNSNKEGTNLIINTGANGQNISNMRPFTNTQSGGIHVGPNRTGNFGLMGTRNMGPQGMQGPFGVRQIPNSMGPMGLHMVNQLRNQQGPMLPGLASAILTNTGIGRQAFGVNHGRPLLGPYRNQMAGPGFVNPNVPRGPMQAPVMHPNATPRPSGSYMQKQSVRPLEIYRGINAFSLKIINIPPAIKLAALCDKLSEFGQVTGLEFLSPGCAMVKFASADDAERCFRNYRQIFQY